MAQASKRPEDRALIDRLRAAKQRLTQLLLEVPKDVSPEARARREKERDKLASEVEQLEGTLARHVSGLGRARRALSVTVEQVQKAVPKQAVLLELLRYSHHLGANKHEPRYGAVVLAASGEPKWVPLGSAAAIETNIVLYQDAVRGSAGASPTPVGAPPTGTNHPPSTINHQPSSFAPLLQALYQQLWAPIEPVLPKGTKTVLISPDGALNFLSFATLLTPEDQFLSQKYSIATWPVGGTCSRRRSPPRRRLAIYANPDFTGKGAAVSPGETTRTGVPSVVGTDSTPSLTNSAAGARKEIGDAVERVLTDLGEEFARLRYLERRDFEGLRLPPLPGTAKESAALAAQANQWQWPTEVFVQSEATEAQLQAITSPHILHLATHGFFLAENDVDKLKGDEHWRGVGGVRPFAESGPMGDFASRLKPQVILKNPMHRSGLALAGAQATLEAWKRGETPPTGNDGIVTAEEVGGLKLEDTWLVTLSACDTGTGEARFGEGVLGLRRGFIQAGAQNLLLTLWSVADEETARLMVEFYGAAHRSGDAPQALAEVQRDWLVKLRKERGLQTAVSLAGPFIMSSQGVP